MSKRHFTTVDGDTITTTQVIAATPATTTEFTSTGESADGFFPDDPVEITVQVGTIDDSGEVVEPSGPSITGTEADQILELVVQLILVLFDLLLKKNGGWFHYVIVILCL